MKPSKRQSKIVKILRNKGTITVEELVNQLETSPETIRRDLTALSASGKLQKIHGGAVLPRATGEGPFQERMLENVEAKNKIAEIAFGLIVPGDTLFIDTGSTTLIFAEELVAINDLTVVTTSTDIAKIISVNSSAKVFLVGGIFNATNNESIGQIAISQLKLFNMTHAILTIGAIDTHSFSDFDINEAEMAKVMIEQSKTTIVLVDSSKMNQMGTYPIGSLSDIDTLVCEIKPELTLQAALIEAKVSVLYEH